MYGNELFDYFCVGQEVDEDDMEFDYSSYGFIGRYDEDDDEEEEDDDDDDEVQFVENPIPTKTTTSSANSKPKQVSQPAQLVRRKLWPEDYYYQLLKWLPKDVSLNDRAAIGLPTDIQSNPYKFANMASYYEFWSDFAIEETRASITNGMRAPDMVDDPYLTDRNQSIELVHVSSSHFATEAMVADQKSEFVYNVRFRVLKKSYCSDLDKLSMTASVFSFRLGGVVKKRKDTSDDRHDYATDEIIFGAISSGFKDNSSGLDKEKGELFVSIIFAGDKYRQLLDAYFQLKEGQIVSATYVCNVLLYHRLFITCAAKPGPACITSLLGESAQNVNGTSVNNNLYPTNTVGRSGLELAQSVDCWTQLNQRQRDSIVHCMNSVLRNPGSLSLVQGPPGCGKTRFIVSLLKTLIMNQRPAGKKRQIVVCAPSNKAICVVLEQVLFFARNNGRRLKCALAGIEGRIEDCATMLQSRHSTESILRSFQCPKSAIDVFAFRFSSNLLRALDDLDWYCQPLCSINLEKCECEYEEDGYEKTLLCSHCIKLPKGAIFLSKGTVAGRSALDVGFTTKERYAGLMNMMIDIAPALEKAKKLAGNRHAMRRDVKALAQLFRVLAKRIAIAVLIMTGDTELLKVVEAASECYGRKTFSESQFSYHSVSKMPVDDEYSEEAVQFQLNEIIKCVKELKVSLGPRGGSTYSDNQREVDEAFISAADIVFCTLGTSGSACVRKRCDIDVMVVDEAAQASEAELIVSLDLLPNHLILVGDPAQLPAFITSSAAQRKGCGMSAMERLLDRCAYDHCFLDTQYRMHPSISAWPNKTFYNSRLLDSEHVQTRSNALLACVKHRFISALPRWLSTPCAFLNMHDSSNERRWGTSYANHREAIMISKIIKYMLDVCDIDVHKQLCVITFYVGQVKAIKESLQKAGLGGLNIRVLTVDSFQGSEADFVILSFVRSNPSLRVGFLKDIQRLNVALTRAKFWLFGVGSISVLEGTSNDASAGASLPGGRHSQHLRDLVRELRSRDSIFSERDLELSFRSTISSSHSSTHVASAFSSIPPSRAVVPSAGPSLSPSRAVVPSAGPSLSPTRAAVPSTGPSLSPSRVVVPYDIPPRSPSRVVVPYDIPPRSPSRVVVPYDIPPRSPSRVVVPYDIPPRSPSRVAVEHEGGEICERCSNHYDRGLQSTDESFVMEIIQNIQKLEQKKQHLSDLITKEVSVQKSSTYESKILQLQDLQSTHRLLMERITKVNMKLLEEALVLSQLEHQLMELRSCHKILHENVETQICVNGAMSSQLRDMNKCLQWQRLESALKLFDAMDVRVPDLDPAPDLNTFAASSIIPSGITQILSLSFPSQGCSHGLGMILPSELICTVLGNVSHLLHCLSTTLHIPLLHPMQPFEISESTISASSDLGNCLPLSPMLGEETQGVGLDEWTAITKAYKTHITRINRSQQGVIKSKRPIGRSNVAQMQESSSFNRDSVHPIKGNGASSHFNKALYLLQTNIIEFCIHIGLKPSQLFPSHCLLHNLYMIRLRCVSLLHNYANPNGNDYLTVKGEIALRQQLDRNELMGHLLSGVSTANPQQTLGALTMLYRSERARDLEE